jgi:tetratricopeptide (TPR) repeat protein
MDLHNNNHLIDYYKKLIIQTEGMKNGYLFKLGQVYETMQNYNDAIVQCFVPILKTDPDNGVVLNEIGVCYSQLSQYKLAIHYFQKVLTLKEIVDVYCNISVCYIAIKEYESAEKTLLHACKLDPNHDRINGAIGELYFYNKKYNKSIAFYQKIKNKDFKYRYNSCFPYLGKKDFKKGLSCMKQD